MPFLDKRYVEREIEILDGILKIQPNCKKRAVPLPLFQKLLLASKWALENGYKDFNKGA